MYFCWDHLTYGDRADESVQLCLACEADEKPYEPKPDIPEWENHKLDDESWATWREQHPGSRCTS